MHFLRVKKVTTYAFVTERFEKRKKRETKMNDELGCSITGLAFGHCYPGLRLANLLVAAEAGTAQACRRDPW